MSPASDPLLGKATRQPVSWPYVTLVLGGARSGKSRFAENLVSGRGERLVYIATARQGDPHLDTRIALHKARRGTRWRDVEAPIDLPQALQEARRDADAILVDCLTLWLTNLMLEEYSLDTAQESLARSLSGDGAPVVLVSTEVGQGIHPTNALARRFIDEAGLLHQFIAARAARVYLVAAGLPLLLKEDSQ